jgi:hypothetical protein
MIFIGIDGPYYVSQLGQVLPLTKDTSKLTQDLQRPFQNIINPSRACAAFSGSIYRVCVTTIINGLQTPADYWFDVTRRRWTGPHTYPYDMCAAYSNYFLISYISNGAALFSSQYIPQSSSVYNDNGTPISVNFQTSFLPKTENINIKQVIESTIEVSSVAPNLQYAITALGEDDMYLTSTVVTDTNSTLVWGGGGVWGGANEVWQTGLNIPTTVTIPWSTPLVFKKLSILITSSSSYNMEIGQLTFKYTDTGMTNF